MPTLSDKLHPQRFPGMSPKMTAIVGYVLGEEWTEPRIAELVITSDNWVLARDTGQIGFDSIIGTVMDLERNWINLLQAAGLSDGEQAEAERLYGKAVRDFRPRQPKPEGVT
jgi:hypothetical protein